MRSCFVRVVPYRHQERKGLFCFGYLVLDELLAQNRRLLRLASRPRSASADFGLLDLGRRTNVPVAVICSVRTFALVALNAQQLQVLDAVDAATRQGNHMVNGDSGLGTTAQAGVSIVLRNRVHVPERERIGLPELPRTVIEIVQPRSGKRCQPFTSPKHTPARPPRRQSEPAPRTAISH